MTEPAPGDALLWTSPDGQARIVKPGNNYAQVEHWMKLAKDPEGAERWIRFGGIGAIAEQAITDLRDILDCLYDPNPCRFDHHGYCQEHGWLQEGECPMARATRALQAGANGNTNGNTR